MDHTKNAIIAVVVVLLIGIMLWEVGKFAWQAIPERQTKITYNNFEFTYLDQAWYFQWQNKDKIYNVPLRFNPQQVTSIPIHGNELSDEFNNRNEVYVTINPEANQTEMTYLGLAKGELLFNLIGPLARKEIDACTKNVTDCIDRPIVTCDDQNKSVIFLVPKAPTSIGLLNNCIVLQGEGEELTKAVDALLYRWYNIIPTITPQTQQAP